jgi:murein DD-endopeptidase MepM/ murein hydrolase activator NlpD
MARHVTAPRCVLALLGLAFLVFNLLPAGAVLETGIAHPGSDVLPRRPGMLRTTTPNVTAMADPVTPAEPRLAWTRLALGRGGTLEGLAGRLGLDASTRRAVLDLLARQLDPARLSPDTGVVAGTDAGGRLRRLAVRAEPERFLRLVWPESGGPSVEQVDLPVVTVVETVGGRVEHSVSQALSDAPHGPELTLAFADIFQWDVDLLTEPRPGDRVRAVYEMHRLGDAPEDLPPFAGRATREGEFVRLGRILAASYDGSLARSTAYWVAWNDLDGRYYSEDGRALHKTFLKSPLNYRRISSRFTSRRTHPVTRKVVPHHGVDFAAASGTPVVAAADGTVAFAGWQGALGRAVRLRHGSHYETVYGHLRGLAAGVRPGALVRQNQVIGYVGDTGRATGPHLHYTLIERGRAIDPLRFDNPPSEPLPAEHRPRLEWARQTWSPLLGSVPTPG